jgi:F0F1-type ATP synthase epsilon subunit
MIKTIKLEVVTPTGIMISKDCKSVSLPSREGIIQIMYGHEPIIIDLIEGEIVINKGEIIKIILGFAIIDFSSCKVVITEAPAKDSK